MIVASIAAAAPGQADTRAAAAVGSGFLALPTDPEVAAGILELEDGGEPEDVAGLLGHGDPRVRARATLAAGRGGWPERQATLLALLEDPEPEVRAAAAFGLGLLQFELEPELATARRERVAMAVAGQLAGPPGPALAGALALGRLGVAAGRPPLEAFLESGAGADAEVVVAGLWAHGALPDAAAGPVLRWLDHGDARVRLAAVRALREVGDPNALPALAPALDDPEPQVRAAAVAALSQRAPAVLDRRVERLLQDRAPEVAVAVLAHLGADWGAADAAGTRLAAVLRASLDRDLHVRRAALAALGPVATTRGAAADRLLQALEEPEPAVRAAALRALTVAGGDLAQRGREWARGRWRDAAGAAPLHGSEAGALAEALVRAAEAQDLDWLRKLADHPEPRIRRAALPRLMEILPEAALEIARGWLQNPADERAAEAVWAVLQLRRTHGLPTEEAIPAVVDEVWAVLRLAASPGQAALRNMALELLHRLAPEILDRRLEYLIDLPGRDLPLTLRRLGHRVAAAELAPAHGDPARYRRLAQRALAAQDGAPTLRISTDRGVATLHLRPGWAPLAVLDVLDRLGRPGGGVLVVEDASPVRGRVDLGAGDWPSHPAWPAAAIPALAESGLLTRSRAPGPPGTGTWTALTGFGAGPAGEVWGRVEAGQRVLSRLQPGDRVRLEAVPGEEAP